LPLKARSVLVLPRNAAGGGVVETRRRLLIASPASNRPADSPTRGSFMLGVVRGIGAVDGDEDGAHAATEQQQRRRRWRIEA
jgi:hypothetical protein